MKKNVLPCVLAVLVLIVAGIIIYEIIRFCQRHFGDPLPQPPPDPTNVVAFWYIEAPPTPQATDAEGLPGPAPFDPACNFTLVMTLGFSGTNLVLHASLPEHIISPEEFSALVDTYAPTNSDSIRYEGGVLSVVGGTVRTVVEASPDSRTWTPVFTNVFFPTQSVQFVLTAPCGDPATNLIYRARLDP